MGEELVAFLHNTTNRSYGSYFIGCGRAWRG